MNHCNFLQQQKAFMSSVESSGYVVPPVSCDDDDSMDYVVCPKPLRRFGFIANPFRLHSSQSDSGVADVCDDSKAGADLFDIIRGKEESFSVVASSPPYFTGSPPSRAPNPLAKDARFGNEKLISVSPSLSPSPFSSRLKGGGGCGRVKFGLKPAAVRVEGFDCLNRDVQNSSIPAIA